VLRACTVAAADRKTGDIRVGIGALLGSFGLLSLPVLLVSSCAARSAITTHGAIVLAGVIPGMMEPSATRRFSTP
jgi:hypothetical protein